MPSLAEIEAEPELAIAMYKAHQTYGTRLRESYGDGPYAIYALLFGVEVVEEFKVRAPDPGIELYLPLPPVPIAELMEPLIISNTVLKSRLPLIERALAQRHEKLYGTVLLADSPEVEPFRRFVELHGRLEAEGRNPRIVVSG